MSPSDLEDLKNLFFQKYSRDYDRFLDEARASWIAKLERSARTETPDCDNPERLRLLMEIQRSNQLYCRRDMDTPDDVIRTQLLKIEEYKAIRRQDGKPAAYFAIAVEEAIALLHDSQLEKARHQFEEAIALLRQELADGERVAIRDIVVTGSDYCYCLNSLGHHDAAIEFSIECMSLAKEVSDAEWASFVKYDSAAPKCSVCHLEIYAYASAADTHVQHPKWNVDELHRRKFRGYWSDGVAFRKLPDSLTPPMKIAILSDKKWVACVPSYALDIAASLYRELGENSVVSLFRAARTRIAGFHVNFPALDKAAAISFICLLAADNPKQTIKDFLGNRPDVEWIDEESWATFRDEALQELENDLPRTVESLADERLSSVFAPNESSPLLAFAAADRGTRGA